MFNFSCFIKMLLLRMRKHIPNIITMCNLFSGCCALVCVFNELYVWVFVFLLIGGFADYADGMVARWLKVKSPLGKELDSLADMVSFGVVPGAIIYALLSKSSICAGDEVLICWWALPGFLISIFAGLRLAKFNLDERQIEEFIGLNTPTCSMFIAGLMLIYHFDTAHLGSFILEPLFLYSVIVVFSFLLIAEIPMFSFKFNGFRWRGNENRIGFLILAVFLLFFFKAIGVCLLVVLYILYSVTRHLVVKKS